MVCSENQSSKASNGQILSKRNTPSPYPSPYRPLSLEERKHRRKNLHLYSSRLCLPSDLRSFTLYNKQLPADLFKPQRENLGKYSHPPIPLTAPSYTFNCPIPSSSTIFSCTSLWLCFPCSTQNLDFFSGPALHHYRWYQLWKAHEKRSLNDSYLGHDLSESSRLHI